MKTSKSIIAKFGGIRPMARALGHSPGMIQGWSRSGYIPSKHQAHVLDVAYKAKIFLSAADFVESK